MNRFGWLASLIATISSTMFPIYQQVEGDIHTLADRDPAFKFGLDLAIEYSETQQNVSFQGLVSVEFRITGGIYQEQIYQVNVFVRIWIPEGQILSFEFLSPSPFVNNQTLNRSLNSSDNSTNQSQPVFNITEPDATSDEGNQLNSNSQADLTQQTAPSNQNTQNTIEEEAVPQNRRLQSGQKIKVQIQRKTKSK